jgi:hypothetical protein
MINVLGRPHLDSVELVIREAAQNAWDARRRPDADVAMPVPPAFSVRIRTLTGAQESAFRELFRDPALDTEAATTNELRKQLANQSRIRVLEVCDFCTSGLIGPLDQHVSVPRGLDKFRNFFFDIGVAHFSSNDGGTYGFGRSALYLAGHARTIVVDSLVSVAKGVDHRFMACRVGHPYEKRSFNGSVTRFTGRHFWGVPTGDGGVGPLIGDAATAFADVLGMPSRDANRTGTSIMIPWPAYEDDQNRLDGRSLWERLLRHLWPKMVSGTGPLAMHLSVEDEGCAVPAPAIDLHPVYGIFASALLVAREGTASVGARRIQLQRPQVVTGSLGLEVGPPASAQPRDDHENGSDSIECFADGVHHVALMRPGELVVKYLDVPNARHDGRQWAGVFICDNDRDIREAFAMSEPPAHDDWAPDRLNDKHARRLVHQTVTKYIPETVRAAFGVNVPNSEVSEDLTSLAAAADAFADAFLSGGGTAPAPQGTSVSRGKGGGQRGLRISRPTLTRLDMDGSDRVATYQFHVSGVPQAGLTIRPSASVVMDGGGLTDAPIGFQAPEILGWRLSDQDGRKKGAIKLSGDADVLIDVAFRGEYALAVACSIESER